MPARQLRLHTPFLKTFLNDLQFLFIRPMTTPGFGVGNGLLAGGGFVAAHDCNRYKISHHPKRRRSPEAYDLLRPGPGELRDPGSGLDVSGQMSGCRWLITGLTCAGPVRPVTPPARPGTTPWSKFESEVKRLGNPESQQTLVNKNLLYVPYRFLFSGTFDENTALLGS